MSDDTAVVRSQSRQQQDKDTWIEKGEAIDNLESICPELAPVACHRGGYGLEECCTAGVFAPGDKFLNHDKPCLEWIPPRVDLQEPERWGIAGVGLDLNAPRRVSRYCIRPSMSCERRLTLGHTAPDKMLPRAGRNPTMTCSLPGNIPATDKYSAVMIPGDTQPNRDPKK